MPEAYNRKTTSLRWRKALPRRLGKDRPVWKQSTSWKLLGFVCDLEPDTATRLQRSMEGFGTPTLKTMLDTPQCRGVAGLLQNFLASSWVNEIFPHTRKCDNVKAIKNFRK